MQLEIGTEITRERSRKKNPEKQPYVHIDRNLAKMQHFCDIISQQKCSKRSGRTGAEELWET